VSRAIPTQATTLQHPLTLADAPCGCGSPSSGVRFSVSSTRLPPGLLVDSASDRLCPRPGPDSRRLYRLRRGGRTPNVIAVEIGVASVLVLVGAVAVTGSLWVAPRCRFGLSGRTGQ
jgi:hypothetical protein